MKPTPWLIRTMIEAFDRLRLIRASKRVRASKRARRLKVE